MRLKLLLLIAVFCTHGALLKAGGFQVNLQGVKQTGMGHCGTAFTGDASVLFFNPAGGAFLKNTFTFTGGLSLITGTAVYYNPESNIDAQTNNKLATPIAAYAAFKVSDKLAFGLSVTTPYGSSLRWEKEWSGRFLVQEIKLRTFFYQATASYKIGKHFSIGGALVYANGEIGFERDIPVTGEENERSFVYINGGDDAFGYNLGLMYQDSLWSVGLSYQSKMGFTVANGEADFTVPDFVESRFQDQSFKGAINTPDVLSVGIQRQLNNKWLLSTQFTYVGWAVYKELAVDFEQNSSSLEDIKEPKNYRNTFILRLGTAFKVNERLDLRAGLSYDRTPVDLSNYGPETPDMNRVGYHTGLSLHLGENADIDFAYQLVEGKQIKAEHASGFNGYYKSRAHVFNVGLNIAF